VVCLFIGKTHKKDIAMSYILVPINASGEPIVVDIDIGNPILGQFEFHLYDENGRNPQPLLSGINSDTIPDRFSAYPNAVTGKYLRCFVRVYQQQVQPRARYNIQVSFRCTRRIKFQRHFPSMPHYCITDYRLVTIKFHPSTIRFSLNTSQAAKM